MTAPDLDGVANLVDDKYQFFLDRLEKQVLQSVSQRKVELEFGSLTAASVVALPVTDFNLHSELKFITVDTIKKGAASEGAQLGDTEVESISDSILDTADKANQTT